jgi:hypothetical protein
MGRIVIGLVVGALLAACSANQATSNVAAMDAPARQACTDLQAVIQARSAGLLDPRELQGQIANVYAQASTSVNPLIRARAVALFADATQLASSGQAPSLDADLAALNQMCPTPGR